MATSRLEALPPEILLQVLAHLPLRPDSVRPNSALVALASASRSLRLALAPVVNQRLRIATAAHAHALLDGVPVALTPHVRALHLAPVTPPWTAHALEPFLHALESLTELRCDALDSDPFAVVELLATHAATASHLALLELDFAAERRDAAKPPWTVRADYPLTAPLRAVAQGGLAPGSTSRCPSLSHAPSEPSLGLDLSLSPLPRCSALWTFVRACLALCPELRTLRLHNLAMSLDTRDGPASAVYLDGWSCSSIYPGGVPRLQVLEFEDVSLDDETLREVLAATSATLDTLVLKRCAGYTRTGLVEAVKRSGQRIRHLGLVAAEPGPPKPQTSASPMRSPTLARAFAPPPPAPPTPPCLSHIIDALLPWLPQLTTLSLASTGTTLLSRTALPLLATHTPHLRALHLCTANLSAADALGLVQRSSGARLAALRVLALHAPLGNGTCALGAHDEQDGEGDDTAAAETLWAAALEGEVRLEGAAFDCARERLAWAQRAAERVAAEGVGTGRRRKRPSLL
ncbi:hypothetical protein JCM3770_006237 [Rhodotorula araucariae]